MSSITTWTRLEPRTRSQAINANLQAKVYDPLWMLARQWQFGEFQGEDNGSPVAVRLQAEQSRLTMFSPGRPQRLPVMTAASPYDSRELPLETLVEREHHINSAQNNFRWEAEAGLHFIRLLGNTLSSKYRAHYLEEYATQPLSAEQRQEMDADSLRYHDVIARRTVNGRKLYTDLKKAVNPATGKLSLPNLPLIALIDPADQIQVLNAAAEWLSWYENVVSRPESAQTANAWMPERMEYEFATAAPVSASAGLHNNQLVLVAPEYTEGRLDWYSFSVDQQASLFAPGSSVSIETIDKSVLPTPVGFRGAPSSRWWEFESAEVNFGAIDAPPDDLARLLMMEFALVYSNDFFMIPVDLPVGSVCRINALRVWNTFGDEVLIEPVSKVDGPGKSWSMFQLSKDGRIKPAVPDDVPDLFFLPPVLGSGLEGAPLEEVHLLRDETANMAWGAEMVVESPAGYPLNRHEAYVESLHREELWKETSSPGSTSPGTGPLEYRLSTAVPEHWIPFVPVRAPGSSENNRTIGLMRGSTLHPVTGQLIRPRGKVLAPEPLIIKEEEIPREGCRITRAYQYARWINGETYLWIGRKKGVGRGEGSSGLRFDVTEPS